MSSNARAYAMILWNRYNESGTTTFNSTDIGIDEKAWEELEYEGVIQDKHDVKGTIVLIPSEAKKYLNF